MADSIDGTDQQIALLRAQGLTPKAIAKKLALRPAQVSEVIRKQAESNALAQPDSGGPVVACLVSPSWSSGLILDEQARQWAGNDHTAGASEGLVLVLVAKAHKYDKVLASSFLLDVFCLGAKSVVAPKTLDRIELESFIGHAFSRIGAPISAPFELAQNLVLGSVDYARSLGLEPDPDFERARSLLGDWTGPGHIQFGREGRPYFVNGPRDDVTRIMATLNRTVGQGNYDVMMMM